MIKPFLLSPVFKDYIWGGTSLKESYHKQSPFSKTAESWELSCHPNGECCVASGEFRGKTLTETIALYRAQGIKLAGTNAARFDRFPVLNKLIDAGDDLSVQVHPSNEYAKVHENGSYGKTEVWYVVDAKPGAQLVYGVNRDMTKEEFQTAITEGKLKECLHYVPAKPGDVFFVTAGTLHAIGSGLLIYEIQQNSDTTYRVYDWDRVGADGKPRQLHIAQAIDVTDLKACTKTDFTPQKTEIAPGVTHAPIAKCEYFTAEQFGVEDQYDFAVTENSFLCLTIADGNGTLSCCGEELSLRKGDTCFIPAQNTKATFRGCACIIATSV